MTIRKVIREDLSGIDFMNGETIVVSADWKDLETQMRKRLALFGLGAKAGQGIGSKEDSDEVKIANLRSNVEEILAGEWRDRTGPRTSQLAQAVANLKNISVEAAVAKLAALSEEQLKALAAAKSVKAEVARIKAERAAAAAEGDDSGLDLI